jgi:hypothetical protein
MPIMTKPYDPACGAAVFHDVSMTRCPWHDPMLPDEDGDTRVTVSLRGLSRLALVASEVGARFQREAVSHDAMAWLLAPRRLFDGDNALSACLELEPAMRAVLLHSLGLGLDAESSEIDDLMSDDEDDFEEENEVDAIDPPTGNVIPIGAHAPRLWTAVLVDESETGVMQAFEAVVAPGPEVARERIRARHGARIAHRAEIREGFDATQPLVEALVAPAVGDILSQVAADPASPLAQGLEVTVAQRFCE